LRCGGEQELIVRAAGSPQSQSIELHDPLEVRKQHLYFLSIFARLPIKAGLGDGSGNIARRLVNAASDPANGCVSDNGGPSLSISQSVFSAVR
jgi:hypothetical protein